nr:hypothetical protein [uncultured Draconibacterium sp.]
MSKYKLHYKHLELEGKIPCFNFSTPLELKEFVGEICHFNVTNRLNPIYLLCFEDCYTLNGKRNEIFIIESHSVIRDLFDGPPNNLIDIVEHVYTLEYHVKDYHLQEYAFYQQAYQQALEMHIKNSRCFE